MPVGDLIERQERVSDGRFSVTLHWERQAGARIEAPAFSTSSGRTAMAYAAFLDRVARHDAPRFDAVQQEATLCLEERGFVSAGLSTTGAPQWVSTSAPQPLEFGTPTVWVETRESTMGERPTVHLVLSAIGLDTFANPLVVTAPWDDECAVDSLLARAHNVTTYQVEVALVDSDYVRKASAVWRENRAAEVLGASLTREAHVKHSRIARILREQLSRGGSGRSYSSRRPTLHIIDIPGTRIVPLIAFTGDDVGPHHHRLLQEEGLQRVDSPWPLAHSNHQCAVYVADSRVFDEASDDLLRWVDRQLTERKRGWRHHRSYII